MTERRRVSSNSPYEDVIGFSRAVRVGDTVYVSGTVAWSDPPEAGKLMGEGDVLILCADHGCDPTWPGSDHTRENIPVLVYGAGVAPGSLGLRDSFADIGQSLTVHFGLSPMDYGSSFI